MFQVWGWAVFLSFFCCSWFFLNYCELWLGRELGLRERRCAWRLQLWVFFFFCGTLCILCRMGCCFWVSVFMSGGFLVLWFVSLYECRSVCTEYVSTRVGYRYRRLWWVWGWVLFGTWYCFFVFVSSSLWLSTYLSYVSFWTERLSVFASFFAF